MTKPQSGGDYAVCALMNFSFHDPFRLDVACNPFRGHIDEQHRDRENYFRTGLWLDQS